jgi:hypothetical protein
VADVVIDTDVASLLQKGRAPGWMQRHVVGARVWLTFVSVGELWKWAEVRSWGERNRTELELWIGRQAIMVCK